MILANSSGGGATVNHTDTDPPELLVAPSTSGELNTVRLLPIPIACWKLEDIRFAFDSSFVTPEASIEFQALKYLRNQHSQRGSSAGVPQSPTLYPPISIFGHADP